MQTEKLNGSVKSNFADSLNNNYQWFYENFFFDIVTSSMAFLNIDIGLKFISLGEKDNIFFAGEDYFVTKIRITKDHNILIRLSKNAIEAILEGILGSREGRFELESLTELEAKILTAYNDFLYKGISNYIEDLNASGKKIKPSNDCHMTIFVKNADKDLGKIIISIPIVAIKQIPQRAQQVNFSIDNFPKTKVEVGLEVGSTKLSLKDLKNIEVDDIVVLENSNINKMVINVKGNRKTFKLVPDPSLIINSDDDDMDQDGGEIMEENISKDMWDLIQVDIAAEFEHVKIPLGDLRQISEGLVVDIGSVYENKVDLKVEDKIIASGELVIINDRYGVRVDKVYSESSQSAPANEAEEANLAEDADITNPQSEDDFNEEDFDYSDFEIEDENI